ncbi:MAG: Gfo/Idh/MocA family oxidoreductase [Bacteroidota bacterium]|nr:Gfo/Idh/MocA family oxidoreductase [Bacteroidota bacterium]MXW14515.1 Gfo/Idh/MocA family oxidoreductase [Rhodothermaceae bacterium]MDE2644306.1 Gfo/Idh/MocA family oxidoreductase [Bacteroidota bacterium]MXW32224.1 Gfo/Idh/MocA family oxidoreductase [Rhodothermaceae bacterium]MXZ17134.1 Gfo/Idh/MocA family oxidoreductase [Rhodothermaceae bacterium]
MTRLSNRRTFIKTASAGVAGATLLGSVRGLAAPSNRLTAAVMGVHSRGGVLATSFARAEGCEVTHICDVDERAIARSIPEVTEANGGSIPTGVVDLREVLENPDVDILVIAAPDHWHAPAAIMALQAGKHVYVEKPCSYNPEEGEMLVRAQKRYDRVVQMGNQQRASVESAQIIDAIRQGIIGRPYYGRAWYANNRGSIGRGQPAEIPDWLNYDLWQGPAPRMPYKDNLIHYNWHWFWHWGTGEICNNGTHEIDICRWALGVDYPIRVTSSGGRYRYDDDWEFYDTQIASFDFDGGKTITWDGRSCNPYPVEGRGRGASIHGEQGTVVMDRDGYTVYDQDNREVWKRSRITGEATLDIRGGGGLTDRHIANMLRVIRDGVPQNSPIDEGHKSTLLCHLGNIAQETGRTLRCDPANGHILDDDEAMGMWGREYEPGWELKE